LLATVKVIGRLLEVIPAQIPSYPPGATVRTRVAVGDMDAETIAEADAGIVAGMVPETGAVGCMASGVPGENCAVSVCTRARESVALGLRVGKGVREGISVRLAVGTSVAAGEAIAFGLAVSGWTITGLAKGVRLAAGSAACVAGLAGKAPFVGGAQPPNRSRQTNTETHFR